jgi:hypothetical protein
MTPSDEELKQISRSLARHKIALIVLSVIVAASTIVTWKSVAAMRAANEIQRQLLAPQKADGTPKAGQARRSSARSATKSSVESLRSPGVPGAGERIGNRQPVIDSTPGARVADTRAAADRPGRQ